MAKIKIEDVIEHLDSEMRSALADAVSRVLPNDVLIDERQLFREFVRAVGRKCSTWETIPDRYVQPDK